MWRQWRLEKKRKLMKTGKTQVEGVEFVGKVSDLKHEKAQVQKHLFRWEDGAGLSKPITSWSKAKLMKPQIIFTSGIKNTKGKNTPQIPTLSLSLTLLKWYSLVFRLVRGRWNVLLVSYLPGSGASTWRTVPSLQLMSTLFGAWRQDESRLWTISTVE